MDARRSSQPATHNQPWELVRKDRQLRGEAKLAWHYLAKKAAGGATVRCTPAEIGDDQGHSETSGRRALGALISRGLLELIDATNGLWTVLLVEPATVQTARPRRCDGQHELPFAAAEPPAEPPAEPSPTLKLARANFLPLHTSTSTSTSTSTFQPIGAIVAAHRMDEPDQVAARLRESIAKISADLERAAPGIHDGPRFKIARAVAEGTFERDDLLAIINTARDKQRAGKLAAPMAGYIVGACKRRFQQLGIEW